MIKNYILVGQTPVPVEDILEWAKSFDHDNRIVKQEKVLGGLAFVSTVFLGFDHQWLPGGPPLIFETMVFWLGEGFSESDCERCSTWAEAEAQHAAMVRLVRRPAAVWAWLVRLTRQKFTNVTKLVRLSRRS